jgi:hypothetical protein
MKKIFTYIEKTWLGDDKEPSIKRILAIAFSIHIMWSITTSLKSYVNLVKAVYGHDKNITAEILTASGASLSNLALVLGIEAGLIVSLLGLASYQSVQIGRQKFTQNISDTITDKLS